MGVRPLNNLKYAASPAALTLEGQEDFNSTLARLTYHDGVRVRSNAPVGFMPYAYPVGGGPLQVVTTSYDLPAAGGTSAIPVSLPGHMILESITFRSLDITGPRGPVEIALWEDQRNNDANLPIVAGSSATLAAYTPTVAANRVIPLASPIYLAPGVYWVTLKNHHATSTLSLGYTATGTLASIASLLLVTATPFGTTLNFTGWTRATILTGIRLNGRVFGQATAF